MTQHNALLMNNHKNICLEVCNAIFNLGFTQKKVKIWDHNKRKMIWWMKLLKIYKIYCPHWRDIKNQIKTFANDSYFTQNLLLEKLNRLYLFASC